MPGRIKTNPDGSVSFINDPNEAFKILPDGTTEFAVNPSSKAIGLYKSDNPVDQKNARIEMTTTGVQYNLYDDTGTLIETLWEQKYKPDGKFPFIMGNKSFFAGQERFVGDAGLILASADGPFITYNNAWIEIFSRTVSFYGTYRMYAQHEEIVRGTSFLQFKKNGVIIASWTNSSESYIAREFDVDIIPGDVLSMEHRHGDNDLGEGSRVRYCRLLADSSTVTDAGNIAFPRSMY